MSRATFYRRQRSTPGHQQPRPTPARALCEAEREQILDVLAGPRFVDRAPAEVVATLLDEGHYLCSERTMYRILAANQPVRERRNQRDHPPYTKPELVATGPNQTWSWDITKLLGPKKWTYFYLYVVLDIFSRYAVGWMVADRENSALAGRLIEQTCHKQGVQPQVLTLHSDRGAPMTSKCTAQLLADLGVTRSLSRPQVSDDNPFSEAQFKTLKYHLGLGRQRLERRSVECFEQFPAGRAQMLCLPPVQVFQPFMDGLVQFGEAEETAIAQAGQNPALDDLDCSRTHSIWSSGARRPEARPRRRSTRPAAPSAS